MMDLRMRNAKLSEQNIYLTARVEFLETKMNVYN